VRSGHILGGWRCILNLSIFLLAISVGRSWSVQSVLEFSAIKKNLRVMSDIERVFWTFLFRMASRVFLFLTPSDSNVVRNRVSTVSSRMSHDTASTSECVRTHIETYLKEP